MILRRQEFYVDYFERPSDQRYPGDTPYPHFQLGVGDVGGTAYCDEDEESGQSRGYPIVSKPNDIISLSLDVLTHLKKQSSLGYCYKIQFSSNALGQINETGRRVLEEILDLHNDLVTPKRT